MAQAGLQQRGGQSSIAAPSLLLPGDARGWTPASLPGLVLWLDAGVIAQADNTAVARWPDLSGQGNHATQGTVAAQPTYLAAGLNGHPALQGDAVDDKMVGAATPIPVAGSAYTVVAALQSAGAGGTIFDVRTSTPFSESRYLSGGSIYGDGTHAAQNTNIAAGAYKTTPLVLSWRYSGTGTVPGFWSSGAAQTILSGVQGTESGPAGYTLFGNSVGEWFPGVVGAVVVYSRALATAERQQVEAWLGARYGIPVVQS